MGGFTCSFSKYTAQRRRGARNRAASVSSRPGRGESAAPAAAALPRYRPRPGLGRLRSCAAGSARLPPIAPASPEAGAPGPPSGASEARGAPPPSDGPGQGLPSRRGGSGRTGSAPAPATHVTAAGLEPEPEPEPGAGAGAQGRGARSGRGAAGERAQRRGRREGG